MSAKEIRRLAWEDLAAKQFWPFVGGYFVLNLIMGMIILSSILIVVAGVVIAALPAISAGETDATADDLLRYAQCVRYLVPTLVGFCIASIPLLYGFGYFTWGSVQMALAASQRNFKFEQCLSGWGRGWKMCWTKLVELTYVQLWSLLFIVPGIVKAFAYAMTPFVQVEHPDWNAEQCITESRRLMDGNKWRYFCLNLSFFGWWALCIAASVMPFVRIVGGLSQYLLMPYVLTAQARFYDCVKAEKAHALDDGQRTCGTVC